MSGFREWLSHKVRNLAEYIWPQEIHELEIHDPDGNEFFNAIFGGGFSASGPPVGSPYKLFCRHDDELINLSDDDFEQAAK